MPVRYIYHTQHSTASEAGNSQDGPCVLCTVYIVLYVAYAPRNLQWAGWTETRRCVTVTFRIAIEKSVCALRADEIFIWPAAKFPKSQTSRK